MNKKGFTIRNRYSDNEEFDKHGRWARTIHYNGLMIAWITRLNHKDLVDTEVYSEFYICNDYFPSLMQANPCLLDKGSDYNKLLESIKNRFVKENKPNSGSFKKGDVSLKKQKIGMYTLNNNLIKFFDSIGDAAKEVGVTNGAIQFACTRSKKSICKKYKWKYENN